VSQHIDDKTDGRCVLETVRTGEFEMNQIKNIFSFLAFSAALLALPIIASAQWNGGGYPNQGGYPGNGGYYPNQGGYGNYGGDMRGTVEDLYNQAKNFEHSIDRGYARSNDKDFRRLVDEFVDASKDLRNNYRNSNAQNDAQRVLNAASQIDGYMGGNSGYYGNDRRGNRGYGNGGYGNGGYGVEDQWYQMRGDLQTIANAYGNRGYNRNNRNRNNSGWRNRFPFPLPY
jgi:hypothetical protein